MNERFAKLLIVFGTFGFLIGVGMILAGLILHRLGY